MKQKNDMHENMIGEATDGSNIENPTPTTEKEPHFPSLEEVVAQMKTLIGQEDFKEERRKESEDGIQLYEISVLEQGKEGMITCVYTYRKADGERIHTTSIGVAYCDGSPDDNDWLPGGYTISNYDEMTGRWRKADGRDTTGKTDANVEEIPDQKQELLREVIRTAKTELPPEGLPELSSETEERYQELCRMLDQAETTFGTTSLEETLRREETAFEEALKARKETNPLLNAFHLTLSKLNHDDDRLLRQWNPDGDLTEPQFNELNLRRIKLSNAVGILYKDASGKMGIRHDLNEI